MPEQLDLSEAVEQVSPQKSTLPEQRHEQEITLVTVAKCPLCGMGHGDQPVTAYELPHPSYSHWYHCNIGNGPVGVLALTDRGPVVDNSLLEKVREFTLSGRWLMIAAWCPPGKGEPAWFWRTANFPNIIFDNCMKTISEDFKSKTSGPPPATLTEADVDDSTPALFEQAAREVS